MSKIQSSAEHLTLNADGSGNDIKFQSNGSEVAQITDGGVVSSTGGSTHADSVKAKFGTDSDLEIYHSGSHAYITNTSGDLIINDAGGSITIQGKTGENSIVARADGAVELYHNDAKKLDTTATGTTTTGVGIINRDVANYATNAATSVSTATLQLKTHSGDSTLTNFGGISGGGTYIQRTNGSGSATYPIALNPYGGDVWIGKTQSGAVVGIQLETQGTIFCVREGGPAAIFARNTNTGEVIRISDDGSTVGTISTNGSATAYNTSSDYRLKENVDYTWDATTRLKQLKPARFNFIADDTNTLVDGFIAHEVSSIVPEAISGAKDAMMDETDEEGNVTSVPDYQGIDQSKLVPLLVKTIQELEARITALEA